MVSLAMPSFSHRPNSVNMADAKARSAPALVAAASLAAKSRARHQGSTSAQLQETPRFVARPGADYEETIEAHA